MLPLKGFKLISPLKSARFHSPYELKWSVSANASSYSISVDGKEIAKEIHPKLNGSVCIYSLNTSKLAEGEHSWTVYAINSDGSDLEASNSLEGRFTFYHELGSFRLISPISNKTIYENLELAWEISTNAKSYKVTLDGKELSESPSIANGIARIKLSGYISKGKHSWQVIAVGAGEQTRAALNNSGYFWRSKEKKYGNSSGASRTGHWNPSFSLS